MNGNCHFVFGATTSSMIALNIDKIANLINASCDIGFLEVNSTTITLFIMSGLIGSVFPDIDNPNSHFGQLSKPVSTVIGKISKAFGKTAMRHRGIFHDPFVYLLGLILSFIFFPPLLGFFVGCLSHIFLDMFNPMGVPCLLTRKGLHLGKIYAESKTAIVFSYTMSTLVLITGIICFYYLH